MDNFQLERYIMASLKKNIINSNESNYDRYHHNTDYNCALSILNHGILSIKTQNDLNISNISNNRLKLLDDTTSHINGIEGISLSATGLCDLYPDEEEYNPKNPNYIDFIISSKIKAIRHTEHYGNEYISYNDIKVSKIKAVDFRLIKLIEKTKNKDDKFYSDLIDKYNILLKTAKHIKDNNLKVKMREMSNKTILDVNKISAMPILKNIDKN